ncbi:hypothetical protein MLD38_030618 [Melastoma candidum]|uniref:Uncharacterized protein n=1 Tax=Melastoma candidum TaxID=119954 RepID=A0ACB9MMS7_9MYRT|nr:hypothetical protein MLD38_030618 [Melastoma candidum]
MKVEAVTTASGYRRPFFSAGHLSPPLRPLSPSGSWRPLRGSSRLVSKAWGVAVRASAERGRGFLSGWDEKPYELLPGGRIAYLDEQDVVTFLDPPKELIPLDPSSYNPSAYLWKKIGEIPEERRHRLLHLLQPRLITRAWEIAGTRFEDAMLAKKTASPMLSGATESTTLVEYYNCRTSGGPQSISWMKSFKKAIFCDSSLRIYGRFYGESVMARITSSSKPLYFVVKQVKEVMATEQPCDLAYEFGDGLWNLNERPEGFPKPEKHPHPFDDEVIVYARYIGPGVLVGQAWQEGKELQQLPQKLCKEILMVKDYFKS